jgi:DNA-3-methyladenine glycosylase II
VREKLDDVSEGRARRAIRRADPRLGAVIRRVGPCPLRAAGQPYAYLVRSILYQQLAGAAARAIEGRFLALFEDRYPAPAALRAMRSDRLRRAGLSRNKIAAVRAVAEAFGTGRVRERRLWHLGDQQVIDELLPIRGVGEWTAHMLLMTSLGRPDVLPVGDYGVRKGAQRLYGLDELPNAKELTALAEPWRPWRSVAAWYLWRHEAIEEVCGANGGSRPSRQTEVP